jgi:hypothetical protein
MVHLQAGHIMTDKWFDYYEQAIDDGLPLFEAARYADAALRDETSSAIDAAEYLLEDR